MASAGDIRAGGASVEIRANDTQLRAALEQTKARLAAFQAESNRQQAGGFFGGGGFRGVELAEGGLRFMVAVQAARVAVKAIQIFSSLIRGDFEGMRKAAEALPFGLGEFVKSVSGPVDEFFRKLMPGHVPYTYDKAAAQKARQDRKEDADQATRDATALAASGKALQTALLSPEDLIFAEVKAMKLSPEAEDRELKARFAKLGAEEGKKAADAQIKSEEAFNNALRETNLEMAKAVMTTEQWIEVQTHAEAIKEKWTPEREAEVLKARLHTLDVVTSTDKAKKAADDAERLRQEALTEGGERNLAQLKDREQALKDVQRSVETPEEALRREIGDLQGLREGLDKETYRRAVVSAVMRYSGGLPSITTQGAFGGLDAAAMRSAGAVDKVANNTERAARAAEQALPLLRELGITFE